MNNSFGMYLSHLEQIGFCFVIALKYIGKNILKPFT